MNDFEIDLSEADALRRHLEAAGSAAPTLAINGELATLTHDQQAMHPAVASALADFFDQAVPLLQDHATALHSTHTHLTDIAKAYESTDQAARESLTGVDDD